jgi:hypothetical protein
VLLVAAIAGGDTMTVAQRRAAGPRRCDAGFTSGPAAPGPPGWAPSRRSQRRRRTHAHPRAQGEYTQYMVLNDMQAGQALRAGAEDR